MKRLQNKCLIASAFTHGLLLLLVVVGSAFVTRKPRVETTSFELLALPEMTVDEPNVVGGGNPNAKTPPQAPALPPEAAAPPKSEAIKPEPKPEVKPPEPVKETKVEPEVIREPVKPAEPKPEPKSKQPDPDSFDFNKAIQKKPKPAQPAPEKPAASFDFGKAQKKTIKPAAESKGGSTAEDNARAQRETQLAQVRAGALSDALKRVQGGLSSLGGSYEIPGPGGPAYASYYLALRKFYEDAWIPPTA
ncbi:MAG TPA: hypothetical protein VK633_07165, partial [Verrucomicrobiae bacterium]|nr:hypothetical protein [Verrucomicrobiae bacterium]